MMQRLIQAVSYPIWDRREGGIRLREYERLKKAQWSDRGERVHYQQERLGLILRHAFETVPFYRSRWNDVPIEQLLANPSRLSELPVLRKADVREHAGELVSETVSHGELISAKTGGSTGVALEVHFDEACQQLRNGAEMWANHLAGWRPGVLVGALWGTPPVPVTFRQKIRNAFHDRVFYLDTMTLNEATMQAFLDTVVRRKARMLFGHAHSLYELARFAQDNGAGSTGLIGIVSTSMMLLEHQRSLIEQVFRVPVTDRYGCEEVGLIACEAQECRHKHLNTDHVVVEILGEDDAPVPEGTEGRIVLTDLNNYGMPLVRYAVGDVGAISHEPCSCGRGLSSLVRLSGRMADYFLRKDGVRVSGISLVEKTLTAIDGLYELQLVQESVSRVTARAIAKREFQDVVATSIEKALRAALTEDVGVDVEFVERLEQTTSGKYRFAICRIGHESA